MQKLSEEGYNGAIIPDSSFTSLLQFQNDKEHKIINLLDMNRGVIKGNPAFFTLVDEKHVDKVRKLINEYTGDFKKIRGGMFGVPLTFFEGSF